MDTRQIQSPRNFTRHPLMLLAAVAVVLFCLVGTAAIMGWLPASVGSNAANRQLNDADRMALAAGMQPTAAPAAPVAPPAQALAPQYAAPPAASPAQPYAPQAVAPAPPRMAEPAPAAPSTPERAHRHRPAQLASAGPNWCANCGNIESVRTITTRAHGSGLGAAGGAVLGGLLGNQVGSGSGRQLATVAGAVGGAVVGNQVEGNMKATHSYEIRVRLDDGTLRTFHQSNPPAWRTGERVRIVKGHLRPA
jgi:outer membrane lipoprotein SlyB